MKIKEKPDTNPAVGKGNDDSAPPPQKRLRLSAECPPEVMNDIVTVCVGQPPHQKRYHFPKATLERHSLFCKRIMESWTAGNVGTIRLAQENCDDFDRFCWFAHTGKLFITTSSDTITKENGNVLDPEVDRIRKAWMLGQKLLSTTFKDALTDGLLEKLVETNRYTKTLWEDIDRGSPRESGIRKLLLDMAIYSWKELFESQHLLRMDRDLLHALVQALAKVRVDGPAKNVPWDDAGCRYHDHGKDETCYKDMFGQ